MKNILLIILLNICFCAVLPAQDKIDRLIDQQATTNVKIDKLSDKLEKLTEQVIETNKQQAAANAKFETKFEGIDKRFDDANKRMEMLFYMMLAMLTGIFGLIGFIVWDRQASMKPILEENKEIVKEIALLKQKDLKHEEKELKAEKFFKKLIEKYPDLANV